MGGTLGLLTLGRKARAGALLSPEQLLYPPEPSIRVELGCPHVPWAFSLWPEGSHHHPHPQGCTPHSFLSLLAVSRKFQSHPHFPHSRGVGANKGSTFSLHFDGPKPSQLCTPSQEQAGGSSPTAGHSAGPTGQGWNCSLIQCQLPAGLQVRIFEEDTLPHG